MRVYKKYRKGRKKGGQRYIVGRKKKIKKRSVPKETSKITLYHGTTKQALKGIMKEGLIPKDRIADFETGERNPEKISLTASKERAKVYAGKIGGEREHEIKIRKIPIDERHKLLSEPAVVAVTMPVKEFKKKMDDEWKFMLEPGEEIKGRYEIPIAKRISSNFIKVVDINKIRPSKQGFSERSLELDAEKGFREMFK